MTGPRVPGWLPPARPEVDPLTSEEVPKIEPPRLLTFEEAAAVFPDLAADLCRQWWDAQGTVYRGNPDHSVTAILPTVGGDDARDPGDVRPVPSGGGVPGVVGVARPLRAPRRVRRDLPADEPGTPGEDSPGH